MVLAFQHLTDSGLKGELIGVRAHGLACDISYGSPEVLALLTTYPVPFFYRLHWFFQHGYRRG